MISNRIRRFRNLIIQACAQDTTWLEANICAYRGDRDVTRLSLLACLRVLCGRNQSGLCYREKRKAIAAQLLARNEAADTAQWLASHHAKLGI